MQRCRTCPSDIDPALLQRLQRWRADAIAPTGVPAYTVFTDLTLQAIAELRPTTPEQLLAITGVGPDKLQRYGSQVLALVGGDTPTDPSADTVVEEGP
jgi:DNA helicase-2/ATP-dependent DNA helicase PcrA